MATTGIEPDAPNQPNGQNLWQRYCQYAYINRALGFSLDISRVKFVDADIDRLSPAMNRALKAMKDLEQGVIANQDEHRMVGHYWLRAPQISPTPQIRNEITATLEAIHQFSDDVHSGKIKGAGGPFKNLLHIGIGGSALGPQFASQALGSGEDQVHLYYLDNTDPDGIDRVLQQIGGDLDRTLVSVVSKSGSTPEPRNSMLETKAAYTNAGLNFHEHAIAVSTPDSILDKMATKEQWQARFAMWDWVGGRTSVMSAAGLLPLALQGIDIDDFLQGAAAMDQLTRASKADQNPAAMLALMWHIVGNGHGAKDMVILPYKDRLMMFSRYLQQLVMESLGKEQTRSGRTVHQGISVYGNKGSTDQHAYIQQLRDGLPNFFLTFLQVLEDRSGPSMEVEPGITSGDYLLGFLQGTRHALYENGRDSITITIDRISPSRIGSLIALFERAVGLYAELVDINAYHQPGVEAGKKAAANVLTLQQDVMTYLKSTHMAQTADNIAKAVNQPDSAETVYKILEHLAFNLELEVKMHMADSPQKTRFEAD